MMQSRYSYAWMRNILEKNEPTPIFLLGQILVDNFIACRFVGKPPTGLIDEYGSSAVYDRSASDISRATFTHGIEQEAKTPLG